MILDKGIDCKNHEYEKINIGKASNLIGQKFNKLVVLFRVKVSQCDSTKMAYWLTQCDCGNLICVSSSHLKTQHTQSCGCLQKASISKLGHNSHNDLTNQIHNGIKFLKFNSTYKQEHLIKSKNAYWDCLCFCGNIFTANASEILRNKIVSCGCIKSRKSTGEKTIENILIHNNIKYIYDRGFFSDLILPSGGIGRYDFILLDNQNNPYRIIEFDGLQHSKNNNYFYTNDTQFQDRLIKDKIKNQYALSHNIPLVRIPYQELKNLSLDLIMSDKYLIHEL